MEVYYTLMKCIRVVATNKHSVTTNICHRIGAVTVQYYRKDQGWRRRRTTTCAGCCCCCCSDSQNKSFITLKTNDEMTEWQDEQIKAERGISVAAKWAANNYHWEGDPFQIIEELWWIICCNSLSLDNWKKVGAFVSFPWGFIRSTLFKETTETCVGPLGSTELPQREQNFSNAVLCLHEQSVVDM